MFGETVHSRAMVVGVAPCARGQCQRAVVSSSVIRRRFQSAVPEDLCHSKAPTNDSLEPLVARPHKAELHITQPLPRSTMGCPWASERQSGRLRLPLGSGRHVTHLQRLSPEKTCRQTPQPGARRVEMFHERAVWEKKTPSVK